MRKSIMLLSVIVIVAGTVLSGCASKVIIGNASSSATVSSQTSSTDSESSVVSSSAPVSKVESSSSYSYADESSISASDFDKYSSYVRDPSDWTYVDAYYLNKYAKLPAPSCIYGCKLGRSEDSGVVYTMEDYDCIVAYFFLIKTMGFEFEELGESSESTIYTIFDKDGDLLANCMMMEISSGPVLFITSYE